MTAVDRADRTATALWAGPQSTTAPLVVLLHGRGSDETDFVRLAGALPPRLRYAALRAPVAVPGGYAWFDNRGLGRPAGPSLLAGMAWFGAWLRTAARPGQPLVLVGFSGGATFAAGLMVDDPARYAGAALLYGAVPSEGVDPAPGALAGCRLFLAQGRQDLVLPKDRQDHAWTYLTQESGAVVTAARYDGGHHLPAQAVSDLGRWLSDLVL